MRKYSIQHSIGNPGQHWYSDPAIASIWKGNEIKDCNRSINFLYATSNDKLELQVKDWIVHACTLKSERFSIGVDASESIPRFQSKVCRLIEDSRAKQAGSAIC